MSIQVLRLVLTSYIVIGAFISGGRHIAWAEGDALQLETRSREEIADRKGNFVVSYRSMSLDPKEAAIIVCDMWNEHWCKGATSRVAEMASYMDSVLQLARDKGMLIIHAPSGTMGFYQNHPARLRALRAPKADSLPKQIGNWCSWLNEKEKAVYPIDQSDGGCDCQPRCKTSTPWNRQIQSIQIADVDVISDSGVEIWNLMAQHHIKNVILMGVHTNMCVLGRPFGLRNMARFGKNVVLMRDLTDTMYNSRRSPYVNHFTGTDLIVEHIEKYVCPTVTTTILTGRPAFRFKHDHRKTIVFLSAESEYKAVETLPEFAADLEMNYGLRCEILQGNATRDHYNRHYIPGMEVLTDADLVVVFARRRALPPRQMQFLKQYLAAGKPMISLRTASHAFDAKGGAPKGYVEWRDFDPEVLGGNYHGHYGKNITCVVTLDKLALKHPILKGVKPFTTIGSLYRTSPLADSTTTLLWGKIPEKKPEPVAWTNRYGKSRILYTSLGYPDDFQDENFRRFLINSCAWSMDYPIPRIPKPAVSGMK